MASLQSIRTGVKTTIEAAIPSLIVYDTVAGAAQVPCAVVVPASADFQLGMAGGGCVEWRFDIYVLAPYTDPKVGQNALDAYVDGSGASSIKAAIKATPGLGLSGVDALVDKMLDYGGEYKTAQVQHIGARLALRVLVTQ